MILKPKPPHDHDYIRLPKVVTEVTSKGEVAKKGSKKRADSGDQSPKEPEKKSPPRSPVGAAKKKDKKVPKFSDEDDISLIISSKTCEFHVRTAIH